MGFLVLISSSNFVWFAEVSSLEWQFISMTEQEEDLIYRMFALVGERYLFSVYLNT